ncbi:SLA class II histocompatibility antigen, DQ haplotype D beta chain-like [Cyprinodon tularosa]|uniref:SLA class II histocompatibility antigen, DQ haplotype D beta chain-like n=1 Tax=Cyprinodon tularosa TaxID=77115 RepID=UPI0018E1EF8D|nr:SLA class II histocompatibility antigen, DQ haplotype D beta chain-like [Cyprinodon tularosa]
MSLLRVLLVFIPIEIVGGFVVHSEFRCLFNSTELKDIQYIYSYIYNKVEFLRFDSNVGLYVGYTQFGLRQADNLNSQPEVLRVKRAQKELFCQHNAGVWYRNILNKSGEPSVTLRAMKLPAGGHPALLTCGVYGFYPKPIRVSWLRDGQEVTADVTSTEEHSDGGWLYQVHSKMEYTPRSGEKISCRVEHASLKEPLIKDWDPSMPESERNQVAIGASGLILGLVLSLAGFIYYKRKARDLLPVPTFEPRTGLNMR